MLPGNTPALMGGAPPDLKGNDAFTKLLMHADGISGSTTFYDYSPVARGTASVAGSMQIIQPGSPLSGGVMYFPGSSYVTWPNSADWEFGAGDFTVDWWEYRGGNGGAAICRDVATVYCPFLLNWTQAGEIYMTSTGSSWDIASGAGGLPNPGFGTLLSAWSHLAVTRSGNTFRAFRDGVLKSTWTSALALKTNANALSIGVGQTSNYFAGYMDEIRISKGVARWTANFTRPTLPYGIAVPATKLIVQVPASGTTSTAFNAQVQAADASNKPTTNYSGTVRVTCNDGAAIMPANSALTNGYGQFSITPKTAQTTTVTATDTVTSSITGSANISVAQAAAQAAAWASTTSWTVPANWNNANNSIECIGGGGNGALGGGGGGGGAYSKVSNVTLTPGEVCNVRVDGPGGYTLFQRQSGTTLCQAAPGGNGAINFVPGAGGNAANGVGAIRYNGGSGNTGGGGGAGGPYGNGGPGGAYNAQMGHEGGGGGGGGGAGGGNASSAGPGAGGNSYAWGGGGAAGTDGVNGGAGTNGGGGGGGYNTSAYGGAGGNGIDMGSWGSGGGGGGSWMTGGGAGGYYGGGGGGGGDSVVGVGRTGLIVVRWQP